MYARPAANTDVSVGEPCPGYTVGARGAHASVSSSSVVCQRLPRRLATALAGLALLDPPLEVPGFGMALVWHERADREPASRWLRDQIAAAAAS